MRVPFVMVLYMHRLQSRLITGTGAGKSSIIAALLRLVELSNGNITVDGIDISSIGLTDLRSRVAIIPQGIKLHLHP